MLSDFSSMIDFFPSMEYTATFNVNELESDTANAPTGNLHPESTESDNARSASISFLDFGSSICCSISKVLESSSLHTIASAP